MKVSEVIIKILECWSYKDVFMVTGGGSMHLNDSFGRSKKIKTIPLHHEQSCAMAADAYFRIKNRPAIVNVTTGPGGINALNGVYGAFVDSIPMIVISGQIKTVHLVKNINNNLRQFGDQEAKIIEIAKTITKDRLLLENMKDIVTKINKIIYTSNHGRKGPVWIDVPLDIQASNIKITSLEIAKISSIWIKKLQTNYSKPQKEIIKINKLVSLISQAERPIIVAGNGVRFSDNLNQFTKLVKKLNIPVCTVWNSHDLLTNDDLLYAGRPGADGERAGNFNVQNSDLLIIIGARMHVRQVGFDEQSFARKAKIVMVDIDSAELNKPNIRVDLKINLDLSVFFKELSNIDSLLKFPIKSHQRYLSWCKQNVKELKVVEKKYLTAPKGTINPYHFVSVLFKKLTKNTDIITGNGTAAVVTFKAASLKKGQRLFTNKGCASMGYDLPAIIGALYADVGSKRKKVLITGDGSVMMNLQELSSLKPFLRKDIKIIILNNEGYHSIRQSQLNYFNNFEVGCGEGSNLYMPEFKKVASCFNLKYHKVISESSLIKALDDNSSTIKLIEVFIDRNQTFEPRVAATKLANGKMASSPLEEMSPLLDKEDFLQRMLIPLAVNSNYEK